MNKRPIRLLEWTTAATAAVLASAAVAQETADSSGAAEAGAQIEQVIVTAQKRSESLQRVPVSITALTGSELEDRQIRVAEDLVMGVPTLQANATLGDGLPTFSLRGISMSDFSLAQNGPVVVYYDEVPKANLAILGLGLYDLERVEVLKGPQGTLYGKNTTGGAVNLVSRKPNFENGGELAVGYGNYNRRSVDGAGEVALNDSIGARLAFTFDRADGWAKNAYPGAPDANSLRQYGVRGSVRLRSNDAIDVTIRASTSLQNPWNFGSPSLTLGDSGLGGPIYSLFGLPGGSRAGLGKREINTPDIIRRNLRTHALAVNADIRVTDDLTLTSITSWDRGTVLIPEDGDSLPVNITRATYYGKTKQIAQDLRLTSDFGGPFNFILGGYLNSEKIHNNTDTKFFSDIDVNGDGSIDAQDCLDGGGFIACDVYNQFDQKKTSMAAYMDLNYALTDQVTLRGGLRYTQDRGKLRNFMAQIRALDGTPLFNTIPGDSVDPFATTSRDFKDNNVSGKIGIDYQVTPDTLLYASYSRGYRGSAFSGQAFFGPPELTIASPEKVQAAEVGFKSEIFDRRVRFNSAVFWYGYEDQQFIDVDPATTFSILINLPKARIYGVEADLQVRATDRLTLSAAAGLIDTEVLRGTSQGIDVRGNQLINAPKFTASGSVDWAIPVGAWGALDMRVDVAHSSGQHFDILNRPTSYDDGYTVVNSRMRLHPDDDRYGIAVWVKNLTNEFYNTNKIDVSGLGWIYTHVNPPRTYGVAIDMKF